MRKLYAMIICAAMLCTGASCGEKNKSSGSGELLNYRGKIVTDEGILNGGTMLKLDTLEEVALCNVPNCSHRSAECLSVSVGDYTPIIYNNCAYYFVNYEERVEVDGKTDYEFKTMAMKYDFSDMQTSKIAEYQGGKADDSGYLIGSEYYFTVNNGDPEYDEAGNISSIGNGGGSAMLSINLETAEITEYGEVFDWEEYKKLYPHIQTHFIGKYGDELYLVVYLNDGASAASRLVTFDIKTHEFREVSDDYVKAMDGKHIVYISQNGNMKNDDWTLLPYDCDYDFHINNLETGETTVIEDVILPTVSVCDGRVWYDNKCFDIKTGKIAVVNNYETTWVECKYKDSYYIGEDSETQNYSGMRLISEKELEKLFE